MPITQQICDHCGHAKPAMMAMAPGRDGKEWYLCGACWSEGREPMKLGMFKTTQIADPHLYDALVSAAERTPGLINMDEAEGRKPKKPRQKRSP